MQRQRQIKSKILSTTKIAKNATSSRFSFTDAVKLQQEQRLSTKDPLPPITPASTQKNDEDENIDGKNADAEVLEENHLPLKLFDGKKQSLDELNAESMAYIWLRRIKEIFLNMSTGRDEENDPFVEFDMNLAKADMANTCDRYIENERITLMKQRKTPSAGVTKNEEERINDEKVKKFDLEKKQEWDMKKLYAEVFKMSYKRNRLKTQAEQDELMPTKTGDDQPNFGNAIWWYSCDKASIYYQINSIVRLENFELLMSYRYYLSDLCRLIEFMYQKRKKEEGDIAHTFYRADNVNADKLKTMGTKQKAFAYIDRISFHPEEKEVLFSMGSSFIVDSVAEPVNDENYYTINLTACEIDKSLVEDIRLKVQNCSRSGRAVLLARYLVELGEYRAARKYLTSLLTQAGDGGVLVNDISLAGVYNCLGITYARQGLHGDALRVFKQALNTQARLEYSNNNALAEIHNNIGLAYIGLGYMDEAEATFDKAVRMQLREPKSNQQYLASIHGNIGYVHYKQKNFDEAEKSFRKAEKIYKQNTSRIAHDALELSLMKAEFLTNYGHLLSVHKRAIDKRKPQDLYNEALKLYKGILSDGDPKLMRTYINIMLAFVQNKSYSEVTKYFDDPTVERLIQKQETNMFELNSSITQASLGTLYELVGACYASQNHFDKAIQVWKDAYVLERKARLEQLLLVTTDGNSSILTSEHNRFIHEWYRRATNHYTHLSNEKTDEKQEHSSSFSANLCLGLLHAKLHNYHAAIECLNKATITPSHSDKEILFVAYLLLADMSKRRQHYEKAITNFKEALKFIESGKSQEDPVLETEVKLACADCHKDKVVIAELKMLKRSMQSYGSDTKFICLTAIVCDTLARYHLMQRDYENFGYVVEQSILLKQSSLSHYHPSLAIDYIFKADCHVQQADTLRDKSVDSGYVRQSHYREALGLYERALEVYNLNLSKNNLEVRKIYYAMGDIMCDMGKLPNAMEKYDAAENNYSEADETSAQSFEEDDMEESVDIWMARASMHRHLAEYHASKKAYKEAIAEMTETVNLYSRQLPSLPFDTHDKKMFAHDLSITLANLRQLAQCYTHLGDILGTAQNEEDGYFMALHIYMKLVPYDKKLEKEEALLYKKVSDYYENLGEHDEALESLEKAVHLGEKSIAALYRLSHLYDICNKPGEAVKNYRALLAHPSIREQKQIKQIVQEKLDAAQNFKKNQNWELTSSRTSDDGARSVGTANSSDRLREVKTTISNLKNADNHKSNTVNANDGSLDYRAMAAAYLELQDFDKARKFYEKDIKQRSDSILGRNIFKLELEKMEQISYTYSQQSMLPFLTKLFGFLVDKMQKIVTLKDSQISTLIDSFVQCAAIHVRFASHLKIIKAYLAAFGLYASESESTNDELKKDLIDMMNSILKDFMQCKLKPQKIIDTYYELSLPNEANQMHLKLIAMHRDNEIEDMYDVHGSSHDSRTAALQHYETLLTTTDDVHLRGVCYYNILRLYKHHLHPDERGKDIVDDLIKLLSKLNILDRRLLGTLAIDFLHDYDTSSVDETIHQKWTISAKSSLDNQLQDNEEPYIGHFLFEVGNLSAAEAYWRSIIKQIEGTFSNPALDLVHDSDATLKEILQAMEHFERDNILLRNSLATAYEKLGDYCDENAQNGQEIDRHSFEKAANMYKKAIKLLELLNIDTNYIDNIKRKEQEAEEAARK